MILITEYNSKILEKNLNSGLFKYIYVKTDENFTFDSDIIKKVPQITPDMNIVNSLMDEIFIVSSKSIYFKELLIDYNSIDFTYFYRVNIDSENFYYILKSPIKYQKLQTHNNIFKFEIIDDIDYYIYLNGFWNGFKEESDGINFKHIKNILKETKIKKFKLTDDIDSANVLIESLFDTTKCNYKKWDYKIHFSGESRNNNYYDYDLILSSNDDDEKNVNIPLFFSYLFCNNFYNKLFNKKKIESIPKHFCCFIVSNGNCFARNKIFETINSYKKVHSYGKFKNNMNMNIKFNYWDENYLRILSNYKFIICFENLNKDNYITEKIINAYLANSIPIYWGSNTIFNFFTENSILYLENQNCDEAYQKILDKIIELDNDDNKYLSFVNSNIIKDINKFNNYSNSNLGKKINLII